VSRSQRRQSRLSPSGAQHAALVVTGANAAIPPLRTAVATARNDEASDSVSAASPLLVSWLLFALHTGESTLADFAAAAQTYDAFADNARAVLDPISFSSDRPHGDGQRDRVTSALRGIDRRAVRTRCGAIPSPLIHEVWSNVHGRAFVGSRFAHGAPIAAVTGGVEGFLSRVAQKGR
jgi:hypothetical protein